MFKGSHISGNNQYCFNIQEVKLRCNFTRLIIQHFSFPHPEAEASSGDDKSGQLSRCELVAVNRLRKTKNQYHSLKREKQGRIFPTIEYLSRHGAGLPPQSVTFERRRSPHNNQKICQTVPREAGRRRSRRIPRARTDRRFFITHKHTFWKISNHRVPEQTRHWVTSTIRYI